MHCNVCEPALPRIGDGTGRCGTTCARRAADMKVNGGTGAAHLARVGLLNQERALTDEAANLCIDPSSRARYDLRTRLVLQLHFMSLFVVGGHCVGLVLSSPE